MYIFYWMIIPTCLRPLGQQAGGETAGSFAVTPRGSSEWVREDPSGIRGAQRSHLTLQTTNRLKSIGLLVLLLTRNGSSPELFLMQTNAQNSTSYLLRSSPCFPQIQNLNNNSHTSFNVVVFFLILLLGS